MTVKDHIFPFWILITLVACQANLDEALTPDPANGLFEFVSSEYSHIDFQNDIEENFDNFFARFNYVYNGGGVAIGDINNDNLPDIFFTGNEVANRLYLNKGDLRFEDISAAAGVDIKEGWHNGVTMVDINSDGFLDIYVCRGGWEERDSIRKNLLFINNGDLTFTEEGKVYGLDDEGYSLQASFFDMDGDEDLDMYLTNRPEKFFLNYQNVLEGKKEASDFYRDKLYQNQGARFVEVGKESGITDNYGYGLGLITADLNKDGATDIYVANDYLENDYLYIANNDGTYSNKIKEFTQHLPFYAMGVDAVDINNDGWEDLIELEMLPSDYVRSKTTMASMNTKLFDDLLENGFHRQYMHNMLQLNQGRTSAENSDIFFSEIGQLCGISKTDWSWSCLGNDFDNDGFRDLFITNGFRRDIWDKDANAEFRAYMQTEAFKKSTNEENARHIINLFKPNKIANYIFRNNGDLTFSDASNEWGVGQASFSNGSACADLDNDGDLDLVVNNIDEAAFIMRNKAEELGNNYIKIKLIGPKQNSSGIGAKVTLKLGKEIQYFEQKIVRGYLSSSDPIIHFGLGDATSVDEILVEWSKNLVSRIEQVRTNQTIEIRIADAKDDAEAVEKRVEPLLVNSSSQSFDDIFKHEEDSYDEFKDQILLPHQLSDLGPCIAVADVNGDGLEDFFVGGSRGQGGKIYYQRAGNKFELKHHEIFEKDALLEDVDALFVDVDQDGDQDLYVVSGGNEKVPSVFYQDRLYINDEGFQRSNSLPKIQGSGACVVALDYDRDGDQDLFVGGRLTVGKYPSAPPSYLLQNNKGRFVDVTSKVAPELSDLGMVSDAIYEDLDGDDLEELIIVGEWMPITVFKYDGTSFSKVKDYKVLEQTSGWWNSVEAADLDLDGDLDLIVGNLGLNYKFKATEEKPLVVYASDFDTNGTNDIFLAKDYKGEMVPIRGKECSSEQMPILKERFKTYQSFAESNIEDILNIKSNEELSRKVNMFQSIWIENSQGEGDLIIHDLPLAVQISSVNAMAISDFDDDGRPDIMLAGNKYGSEIETTRADASIGHIVFNKEDGLKVKNTEQSGFFVRGQVSDISPIKMGTSIQYIIGINDEEIQLWKANLR